jgi:hypothetical protein
MSEWNLFFCFFFLQKKKRKKKDLKIKLVVLGQKSKVNERKKGGGDSPATSDGLEPTSKASSTGLSTGRKAVKDTESISEVKMNELLSFV